MILHLQPILDRLQAETSFSRVERSSEIKPNLVNSSLTAGVVSYVNTLEMGEGYADYGERYLATVLVQLVTSATDEEKDVADVYAALAGWNPQDVNNRELSALSLHKASLMDINNDHYLWFMEFQLTTPTLGGTC